MKHVRAGQPAGRPRRAVLVGGFAVVLTAAVGLTATAFAAGTASLQDNFEDGESAGWAKSGGSWSVATDGSKVLRQSDAGSALARMFNGDAGWTDYTLQALAGGPPTGRDPPSRRRGGLVTDHERYLRAELRRAAGEHEPDRTAMLNRIAANRGTGAGSGGRRSGWSP